MLVSTFIFLAASFNSIGQSQISADPKDWATDLDFLKKKSLKVIPSREEDSLFKAYLQKLEALSQVKHISHSDSMVFELQKSLHLIGDDGSNIIPFQTALNLDLLPVKAYWFHDGLFITDAKQPHLIGKEITAINGISISTLFDQLQPYLNSDNIYYQKMRFPIFAFMPRLLYHLNIGTSRNSIELTFSESNKESIEAESVTEYVKLKKMSSLTQQTMGIEANSFNYWKSFLEKDNALYIQLKKIEDDASNGSFKTFVGEIENDLNNKPISQIILDLRYGGSGNGFKLKPLIELLKSSPKINQKGHLMVLVDGNTKGPLVELASILEQNTKCLLIGQPTAEGPNSVSDTRYLILNQTGLGVSLTEKYWPTTWSFDQRNAMVPDLPVNYQYDDFVNQKDPWVNAALDYSETEIVKAIPESISGQIIGKYIIDSEELIIQPKGSKLYMIKRKKLATFFELHTELNHDTEGLIKTDIKDVNLSYLKNDNNGSMLLTLNWKGTSIPLVRKEK